MAKKHKILQQLLDLPAGTMVEITWSDAARLVPVWIDEKEVGDSKPPECVSIGYFSLYKHYKKRGGAAYISLTKSDAKDYGNCFVIPVGCITKIRYLGYENSLPAVS